MLIDSDFVTMRFDDSYLAFMRYVVKGCDRNGDERILTHTQTRKEAAAERAAFQRTRGGEFTRIWIVRSV